MPDDPSGDAAPTRGSHQRPLVVDRFAVAVALVATVVGLRLDTVVPRTGLDPSWMVGLSLARSQSVPFGSGVVFTYGPLGFLSVPLDLSRSQLLLGMCFSLATAFALYLAVVGWLRTWLGPVLAVAVTLVVAVLAPMLGSVEMAMAALVLWVLWFVRREADDRPTPLWVLAVLGAVVSLLALVKFGAAVLSLIVLVLALIAPDSRTRLRRVATTVGSAVVAFALLWLVAGQRFGDLPIWVRRSIELALGYNSAMVTYGTTREYLNYLIGLVPMLLALIAGVVLVVRTQGRRSLPFVMVLALSFWLFLKEAAVRFDTPHRTMLLVVIALLLVPLPWRRRWVGVGVVGILFCFAFLNLSSDGLRGNLRELVRGRLPATQELAMASRELVDAEYHHRRLTEADEAIRASYAIDPAVLDALAGERVHAEPFDIAAVYGYRLDWRSAAILQTYASYRDELDTANAASLIGADGPTALLYRPDATDGRNARWESPDYQVAIVCNYEVAASVDPWQALKRAPDICGEPSSLGRVEARAGEPIAVPEPSDPGNLVVARMQVPTPLVDRLLTLAVKEPRRPDVTIDGHTYSFVAGTAGGAHLVRQPGAVAGRALPGTPIEYRTMRFDNVGGPVVVEFFEIPLRRGG